MILTTIIGIVVIAVNLYFIIWNIGWIMTISDLKKEAIELEGRVEEHKKSLEETIKVHDYWV